MKKIVADPKVMLGKPTVDGTRITVEQILMLLAQKLTIQEILEDFPQLTEKDIQAAVKFAAKTLANLKQVELHSLHEVSR